MNFQSWLQTKNPSLSEQSILVVLSLAGEGATVPFMARYRKEKTGNLDETQIQFILDLKEEWDHLVKRQAYICDAIEKQGKLTSDLKEKISQCYDLGDLEVLYVPFKQKRKTKAMLAKEAGLQPLADFINQVCQGEAVSLGASFDNKVNEYLNEEKGFATKEDVLSGVRSIVIESLNENLELRAQCKKTLQKTGTLKSKKTKTAEEHSKYEMYFDYEEPLEALAVPEKSHRYLAIRRGWLAKEISLAFGTVDGAVDLEETLTRTFQKQVCPKDKGTPEEEVVKKAAELALKVYVLPSCGNELHKELKAIADLAAIGVFSSNVKQLLLSPPFGARFVMGIDPGNRM